MKTRGQILVTELISEVVQLLHFFKPQVKDVKARIDALIGREFIQRDEKDRSKLHYLA